MGRVFRHVFGWWPLYLVAAFVAFVAIGTLAERCKLPCPRKPSTALTSHTSAPARTAFVVEQAPGSHAEPIYLPPRHFSRDTARGAYGAGLYSAAAQWYAIAQNTGENRAGDHFSERDYYRWTISEVISGNSNGVIAVLSMAGSAADPRLTDALTMLFAAEPSPFEYEPDCSKSQGSQSYVTWDGNCSRTMAAVGLLDWIAGLAAKRGAHYASVQLYARVFALSELLRRHGFADEAFAHLSEQVKLLPYPLVPTPQALRSERSGSSDALNGAAWGETLGDSNALAGFRRAMLDAPWWPLAHRNYGLALAIIATRVPEAQLELDRYDDLARAQHPDLSAVRQELASLKQHARDYPAQYRVGERTIEFVQ
jgi:hypothetical protein